jgi:[acyl-carrier-protein] S-malonyltransferase
MGRFALVFPGQGSQHPGMGQNLYRGHQSVRDLFAEAGNVLGTDMVSLCFTGPQELLDLTVNTQIAVLTVEIAAWRAFSERVVVKPFVMAGHSLGSPEGAAPSGGRSRWRWRDGGHSRPPAGGGGGFVP